MANNSTGTLGILPSRSMLANPLPLFLSLSLATLTLVGTDTQPNPLVNPPPTRVDLIMTNLPDTSSEIQCRITEKI